MENVYENIDVLFRKLYAMGQRVEELEKRIIELERRLSDRETEVTGPRPILALVGTADRCESIGAGQR
jgi:hypothetical protein